MRYLQMTHTYVIPVPEEDWDEWDAIAQAGATMIEKHLLKHFQAIMRGSIKSHWEMMPAEYNPPEVPITDSGLIDYQQLPSGEVREPGQVSFTEDVMGQRPQVTHPWDQGLWIFPEDHPLAPVERRMHHRHSLGNQNAKHEFQQLLEAGAGDDDEEGE